MVTKNPFSGLAPKEISLTPAPLVKVISQIKFPTIASISNQGFIAPFQESLRHHYPKFVKDEGVELNISPQGGNFSRKVIWRMLDKSQKWRVSLGENFLSLETDEYPGRTNFLGSLKDLIEKINSTVRLDLVERVGLRYINRIFFPDKNHLATLLQPGFVGIVNEDLQQHLMSSFCEARFTVSDHLNVNGKWGLVPGNQTYDPTVLSTVEDESWILDIDGYRDQSIDFEIQEIISVMNQIADVDYRFFRFVVTDAFLRKYGGTL